MNMSVSYFIEIEGPKAPKPVPCGTGLADNIEDFDERLDELGLPPLLAFFYDADDLDDEDADDEDEDDDDDADDDEGDDFDPEEDEGDDDDDGAEEWFDPEEGLESINALIAEIESGELPVAGEPEQALKDLRAVKTLLEKAKATARGWRLCIEV